MNKNEAQIISDEVVELLRKDKEAKGISNYQISQLTGLGEGTLSLIDRLKSQPSFHVLVMMATATGADLPGIIEKVLEKHPYTPLSPSKRKLKIKLNEEKHAIIGDK